MTFFNTNINKSVIQTVYNQTEILTVWIVSESVKYKKCAHPTEIYCKQWVSRTYTLTYDVSSNLLLKICALY